MPKTKENENHYIDNKEFLQDLKDYNETDELTEELHMKFYILAKNYSHIKSFRGYPYIEDMVIDAYMRCVRYAKSFDVVNKDNPFAYFTMVVHNVFLNYISREKKHQDKKWKSLRIVYEQYMIENGITLTLPDNIKEKMYGETNDERKKREKLEKEDI
jgi:DNA-directed RNA polymerase specialized sigma24 family protein